MEQSPQHSDELQPALSTCYLRLLDGRGAFQLHVGPNTIGRCTPDLVDPTFISIDNENVAISRLHASVIVAPNGDGWIRDLGSTNGTYVAVREGEGLHLDPSYVYQAAHGNVITLGDLHTVYHDTSVEPLPGAAGGVGAGTGVGGDDREGGNTVVRKGAAAASSSSSFSKLDASAKGLSSPTTSCAVTTASKSKPYLDDEDDDDDDDTDANMGVPAVAREDILAAAVAAAPLPYTIDPHGIVSSTPTPPSQSASGQSLLVPAVPLSAVVHKTANSKRDSFNNNNNNDAPPPPQQQQQQQQPLSFMDSESDAMLAVAFSSTCNVSKSTAAMAADPSAALEGKNKSNNRKEKEKEKEKKKEVEEGKSKEKEAKTPAAKRGRKGASAEGKDGEEDASKADAAEGASSAKKARAEATATATARKGKAAATGGSKAALSSTAATAAASIGTSSSSAATATATAAADDEAVEAQRPPTLSEYRSRLGQYVWPKGQRLVACLSGMDTTDRERVANRIRLMGGHVVEEWSDRTTLLVVKDSPATRTPKFLNALAKGVMIVTSRFFTDQLSGGNLARLLEFVPDLQHSGTIVPATDVVDVILYQQEMRTLGLSPQGALSGMMFAVTEVPPKVRNTVSDVIAGCGGRIVRNKRDEAKAATTGLRLITLSADDVDKLYDAIVTGSASRFKLA